MERLTERDEYGNADIVGVDSGELQLNLEFEEFNLVTGALNRLAEYEDLGLSPEEVKEQIEILEHNYKSMEDTLGRQCNNALKIVNKLQKDYDYWKREAIKAKAQLGEIRILVGKELCDE